MKWIIGAALSAGLTLTSCASTSQFWGGLYSGVLEPSPRAVYTVIYPHPIGDTFGTYTYAGLGSGDSGTLRKCSWETPRQVLCSWQDASGVGTIRLTFDARYRRFKAFWTSGASDVLPYYWDGTRIEDKPSSLCNGLAPDACLR